MVAVPASGTVLCTFSAVLCCAVALSWQTSCKLFSRVSACACAGWASTADPAHHQYWQPGATPGQATERLSA